MFLDFHLIIYILIAKTAHYSPLPPLTSWPRSESFPSEISTSSLIERRTKRKGSNVKM